MPRAARRHRSVVGAVGLATLLAASGAHAQGRGAGGFNSPGGALPPPPAAAAAKEPGRPSGGLSEFATDETVAAIRIRGNRTVPESRITQQMQTRVGRPFDPKALGRDVRTLVSQPYFITVRPFTESTAEGRVVILEVVERATIRYVVFLGNESIKDKKLVEETGLRVGGAIDPYSVEEGKRKIEALYKENGFGRVFVKIEEGLEPTHNGVVYLVTEGPKQRVRNVRFEGNAFATDGQLKTKIKTKPNLTRLWGGKIREQQLEQDLNQLTDYYRSFGFFGARVGRILEFGDSGEWADLTFVVNEGPRYAVRNVSFFGVEKFNADGFGDEIDLRAGEPFERAKLNRDLAWLKQVYGSKGYIYADIRPETVFLEEPGKVDLIYNIDEGSRFRVGEIKVRIRGEASHTRIQTAMNRLSIRPGEWVDTREIQASERRLSAASIFNTNPTQGTPPKISYRISSPGGTQVAAQPQEGARQRTAYKPPIDDADWAPRTHRVRQVNSDAVNRALAPTPPAGLGYSGGAYGAGSTALPPAGQALPAPPTTTTPAPLGAGPPTVGLPPQGVPLSPQGVTPAYATAPPTAGQPAVEQTQFLGGPITPRGTTPGVLPGVVTVPSPGLPPNDPTVDLFVDLEETQTGRFMVGVAVNSDAGVVGQILLDEQNFDWRRLPRSFQDIRDGTAFRGGGQRFRLEAAPGSEVQRYLASWQEPYLLDTPISLSLSGSYFTRRFEDYDEQRLGGRVGLGYQWTDNDLSAQLTYRGENVNISEVNVADADIPELAEVIGDNTLHGFGIRIVNDTRDNPFLATEGYYLSTTLEGVIGTFDYPRAEFEGRTYYLLRERADHTGRHVLVLQTRLGFTGSNTPVYDRFFAGGFSTMRGFDFRGASPIGTTPGGGLAEIGGDFRWINTVEYLFPLTADGMVNGVAFVDFGTVEENVTIEDFRVAPGVGLRFTVPAMGPAPIALDFAFPVASADFDDEQVFTFNVGFLR